jgi:disulfide oxidoreductase YuzD
MPARVLHMNADRGHIIGAPVACADGVKDTWRDVAEWAAGQLAAHFGESVQVQYFDLFDPARPPLPPGAQLPLVLVNGEVLSSGGKISVPAIRRQLEALGLHPDGH